MTSPDDHTTPDPTDTGTSTASGPSLSRLLATWQAWSSAETFHRAAARAAATGEHEQAARLRELVARDREVAAVDALAAQHEIADLLAGWEWHTVRAAREQGATWADIAHATRTDQARTAYLDQVNRQEQAAARGGMPFDDAADYRAAAGGWFNELHPDIPDHVVEEIEGALGRGDVDELAALRAAWWNPHHTPPVTIFPAATEAELERSGQAQAAAERGDNAEARRLMGIDDAQLAALLDAQAAVPLHVQIAPGIDVPVAETKDGYRNHSVEQAVTALAPLLGSRTAAERAVTDYLAERYPQMGPAPYGAVFADADLVAITYPSDVDPWTPSPAVDRVPHTHAVVDNRGYSDVAIDATDAEIDAVEAAQDAADRVFHADTDADGDALAAGHADRAELRQDRPWLAQGTTLDTAYHHQVTDRRSAQGETDEQVAAWPVMPEWMRERARRRETALADPSTPAGRDERVQIAARIAVLREQIAARDPEEQADERREQLARWHSDDTTHANTDSDSDTADDGYGHGHGGSAPLIVLDDGSGLA